MRLVQQGGSLPLLLCTIVTMMIKSSRLDQTQLIEAGVTPQHAFEIKFLLNPPRFLHSRFRVTRKVDDATVIHRSTSSTGFRFSRQNLLHTWSIYPRRTMSVRKTNGCSRSPLFSAAETHTHPHRLPRIKAWIDANNPGDPLIPFSVALEERLAPLPAEEKAEEEKNVGATSALGKITQAGYTSLDVSSPSRTRTSTLS